MDFYLLQPVHLVNTDIIDTKQPTKSGCKLLVKAKQLPHFCT